MQISQFENNPQLRWSDIKVQTYVSSKKYSAFSFPTLQSPMWQYSYEMNPVSFTCHSHETFQERILIGSKTSGKSKKKTRTKEFQIFVIIYILSRRCLWKLSRRCKPSTFTLLFVLIGCTIMHVKACANTLNISFTVLLNKCV